MPLVDLTDPELNAVAMACRAAANRDSEQAKKIGDPTMSRLITNTADKYRELAERFEAARKSNRRTT